jgi:DNA-binding CsgD family transcriptional regulator
MGRPTEVTVGRHDELATARGLLDAGCGVLVLRGPLGVGKSHLARAVAGLALDGPWVVHSVAGSSATPTVPFAPWAHLLDEVPVDATPAALVSIALARLRAERESGPLLVVIDDAHRLDELSMAMAVHVLRSPDLLVVITTRPGVEVPGPLADVLREGRATVIDVTPLDRGDLPALAATTDAPPLAPPSLASLWHVTEGNPLFALELLRGGFSGERPSVTLAEVVALRMAELPPDQRSLLELLAVGGTLDERLVRDLVGDEALLAAEQAGHVLGAVEANQVRVGLTHPVYADSLRAGLGVTGVRARLRELVAAATRPGRPSAVDLVKLAVWHAELGEPFDPSAVGMASRELRWGFHDWLRRGLRGDAVVADPVSDTGRVTAAYRLARLAWERDPSWATGYALLRTLHDQPNRLDEFAPVLAAVEQWCTSEEDRATLTIATALWLTWTAGRWSEADALLSSWEQRLGPPHRQLLTYARGGLMVQRGDIDAGAAVLRAHRPAADFPAAVQVAWQSPWSAACAMGGRFDEAVDTVEASLPVALELGDEAMVAVFELVLVGLWARLYRGDLRDAEQRALAVRDLAGDTATAEGRALLGGVAARSMLWQGRVTDAIDLLRDGTIGHEEPSTLGFRPLLHTTLAVALVAAGQPGGDAEVAAARSLWRPPRLFDADLGVAAAHVAAAEGHTRAAATLADEAAIEAAAKGNRLFALLAAHTANGIAPDDDRRSRLVELAAAVDGPLAALLRRQAELSERSDPAEADLVAEGLLALGANHQALLTSTAAVGWHRRAGRRDAAARSHGAATRALAGCPGLAHASRGIAPNPADSLTKREREVATLAARSWSTAAIADELGVSERTVESHLYRAFGKLGVTSRAELAAALAG